MRGAALWQYIGGGGIGKPGQGGYTRPMRSPMQNWHVYLLRCADDTLYCGITTDLARRLAGHRAGTASKYTRARLPVEIIAHAPCADKSAALRLELAVKARPRAEKLAFLLGQEGAQAVGC